MRNRQILEKIKQNRSEKRQKYKTMSFEAKDRRRSHAETFLRNTLPVLTREDIRRYRCTFHEALIQELQEKGYPSSSRLLGQLLKYQEMYREAHKYDVIIMARPLLVEDRAELQRLYDAFMVAETAHHAGKLDAEIDQFLQLINFYAFGPVDWWWLAEQLISQTVRLTAEYTADGGKRDAQCKFLYGKYLVKSDVNAELGLRLLRTAKTICADSAWETYNITGRRGELLHVQVCQYLRNALVDQIKAIMASNPSRALEMCKAARRLSEEACMSKAEVYFLQGRCAIAQDNAELAQSSLEKAQLQYNILGQYEECCEARIALALSYLETNKSTLCYNELQQLLKYTKRKNLPKYTGLAYLYLGQYHLNQGDAEKATPMLVEALNIFHELNDVNNREFVKNLAAISAGQEVFSRYVHLILYCHESGFDGEGNLQKLLKWKDSRELDWDGVPEYGTEEVGGETAKAKVEVDGEEEEEEEDGGFEGEDGYVPDNVVTGSDVQ